MLIDSTRVLKLEDLLTYTIKRFRYENGYSPIDGRENNNEINYNDDEETVKDDEEIIEDFIDENQYDKNIDDDNMYLEEVRNLIISFFFNKIMYVVYVLFLLKSRKLPGVMMTLLFQSKM